MSNETRVLIFGTARGALDHAARTLQEACSSRPGERIAVALAGGSTPQALYEKLAADYSDRIPWERLEVFFSDERPVIPDDPQSHYRLARDPLLSKVPVPAERVHRMHAEEKDIEAASLRYEEEIRRAVPAGPEGLPVLDLVWLGLGVDGHTASLFPGTAALDERERLVAACEVPVLGTWRMTLTLPFIQAARMVQVLVFGAGKAAAVRRVLDRRARLAAVEAGECPPPAARIRPTHGRLEWVLDRAAAGEILDPGLLAQPESDSEPQTFTVDPWKIS